ncbi:MAG: sulfatase-like hydrolase/transferase, partial [Verrucomicrobiota bacterium]
MKRLSLLSILVAFSGSLVAQEKMNFLFFLADDLGYHDVGFNNPDSFYETPNLDQLAASGMVFTDFYAASQVCSPTRASIFNGKYPARTDTTNFFSGRRKGKFAPADFKTVMALEEVTMAEALKEEG